MQDLHASIRKSSTWVVARMAISLSVGAFITTYIIRTLSVEEYGIYTILFSLIGYVSVIGSFGIPEIFRRYIPEALQKEDYGLLKNLVVRGLILRVLLSSLTVCIILLLHGPIGQLLKLNGFLEYFSVLALGIILSLEASLLTSVLHSLFLHKYSVIASTIYTMIRGASLFVLLKFGWGIKGILYAEVISWGLWTALQWYFYHTRFARQHPTTEKINLPMRRYARYGGYSALNEIGSSALGVTTDYFIITAFLGPGAVALYAFANRVIKLFVSAMPHVVLIDVIRPSFFVKYAETGNKRHLNDMFNLLVKIGAFFVFPLAAGMFALGDKMIILIFKPDYLPALTMLWILIVFTAINVFASPTGLVLQATEQVQINLYSKFFAVIDVVVAILIVERYGVMGVMMTTSLTSLMKNIYCYWFARKYGQLSTDWWGLGKIVSNSLLMAIFLWLLRPFTSSLSSLALIAGAGGGFFLLASSFNKAFTAQERSWINRVVPRAMFIF